MFFLKCTQNLIIVLCTLHDELDDILASCMLQLLADRLYCLVNFALCHAAFAEGTTATALGDLGPKQLYSSGKIYRVTSIRLPTCTHGKGDHLLTVDSNLSFSLEKRFPWIPKQDS